MPRSMEALFGRSKTQIQNLDRSQKPPVFYGESEIKPKTSKMGSIPVTV